MHDDEDPGRGVVSDVWDHLRLLSDDDRNDALLALLERRAPGARVVEVGCGTGLLSCVAARLGATRVTAIEPGPFAYHARALVRDNGLDGIVEVIEARAEDVPPRPVDLAFSELLNADPFVEGVLEAMDAVRSWVVPGGLLAPHRLRVRAALARAGDASREARNAARAVHRVGKKYGLDVAAVSAALAEADVYRFFSEAVVPLGPPVTLWDIDVGSGQRPEPVAVRATVFEAGPVAGAVAWFEADLDDGLVHTNRDGGGGHWGRLVCAWPTEIGLRASDGVELVAEVEDGELFVRPT